MSGIIFCACSMFAISVLQCSETMARRSEHGSWEERVTAKSRPIMNLIARVPSNVSSSTLVSLEKRHFGNQDPWSTIAEQEERSWRPDIGIDRMKASDFFTWAIHGKLLFNKLFKVGWRPCLVFWSGKTDTEMYERSGRPDETSWRATR